MRCPAPTTSSSLRHRRDAGRAAALAINGAGSIGDAGRPQTASHVSHAAQPHARAIAVAARSGVGNIGSRPTVRDRRPDRRDGDRHVVDVHLVEQGERLVDVALIELHTDDHTRVDLPGRGNRPHQVGEGVGRSRGTGIDRVGPRRAAGASGRAGAAARRSTRGPRRRRRRRRRLRAPAGRQRCRRGRGVDHVVPADGRAADRRRSAPPSSAP